jgi:hypothetical protein
MNKDKLIKRLEENQVWYSDALEVLGLLRFHLFNLIEDVDCHNRVAPKLNQLPVASRHLEEARIALENAETFFCGKNNEQLRPDNNTSQTE